MKQTVDYARFPMLRDQVRASTGFTHAPGGVMRLPPNWGASLASIPRAQKSPAAQLPEAGSLERDLYGYLVDKEDSTLAAYVTLANMFGTRAERIGAAMRRLQENDLIVLAQEKRGGECHRAVRIVGTGAGLKTPGWLGPSP